MTAQAKAGIVQQSVSTELRAAKNSSGVARGLNALISKLGPEIASREYHTLLVAGGYDSYQSFKSLQWADALELGVLREHAYAVVDAIRGSTPARVTSRTISLWKVLCDYDCACAQRCLLQHRYPAVLKYLMVALIQVLQLCCQRMGHRRSRGIGWDGQKMEKMGCRRKMALSTGDHCSAHT